MRRARCRRRPRSRRARRAPPAPAASAAAARPRRRSPSASRSLRARSSRVAPRQQRREARAREVRDQRAPVLLRPQLVGAARRVETTSVAVRPASPAAAAGGAKCQARRTVGAIAQRRRGELPAAVDDVLVAVDRHDARRRRASRSARGCWRGRGRGARPRASRATTRALDLFLQVEHRVVALAAQRAAERGHLAPRRARERRVRASGASASGTTRRTPRIAGAPAATNASSATQSIGDARAMRARCRRPARARRRRRRATRAARRGRALIVRLAAKNADARRMRGANHVKSRRQSCARRAPLSPRMSEPLPLSLVSSRATPRTNSRTASRRRRSPRRSIVVDSGSSDDTVAIARALRRARDRARVARLRAAEEFRGRAGAHDWVLCLDADERVTPELGGGDPCAVRCGGRRRRRPTRSRAATASSAAGSRTAKAIPDWNVRLFDRRHARWTDKLLNMNFTDITDEGVKRLHAMRNLEDVLIGDTLATTAAADSLQSALPKARIYHSTRENPDGSPQ